MSDSEDPVDLADEGGDDLFGDDEPETNAERERYLSDTELDRDAVERDDDDMDRDDDAMEIQQTKEEIVMDVALSRHRIPKTKNGTVRLPVLRALGWF
jgi:RNA polymerase-associated protein LEO1